MADRLEEICVRANLQERRSAGMWELPNDRSLISHAINVLPRIIQIRLEVFLIPELPIEQAGFRRGRGTREHIANLRLHCYSAQ